MEINRNNVFELINKCNVKPDKDYGQNYLVEPTICENIVSFLGDEKGSILEIGPGLGSLTHYLRKDDLTLCDIDSRMIAFLKPIYGDKVHYVLDDIRNVDVFKFDYIIGNLPYNITTELVTYLLLNADNAKKMILMCQLEAFSRFFDTQGENYGPVSVLLHLLGDSKKLLTVKAGSFTPVPKCNSVVFSFMRNPVTDKATIISVYKMSKTLFLNRRKTIYNNLKNYISDVDKINNVLKELNIEPTTRPEQISPTQFLNMYQLINK